MNDAELQFDISALSNEAEEKETQIYKAQNQGVLYLSLRVDPPKFFHSMYTRRILRELKENKSPDRTRYETSNC